MKILKFGAVWCSGCLVMKPRWKEIEQELPWLVTEYFDVDDDKNMASQYNLTDYPAFVFLDKDGTEIHREYGELEKQYLIDLIQQYKEK